MTRHRYTAAERAAIFAEAKGICHLCGLKIRAGEDWEVSHIDIPADFGGRVVGPAHYSCHKGHTGAVTAPLIAKARQQRHKHLGAFQTKAKLPCGRHSRRSKGLDGRVKERVTGQERQAALRQASPNLPWDRPPIARRMMDETAP